MPQQDENTEFIGYKRLFVSELERLDNTLKDMNRKIDALQNKEISDMKVEIALLKLKAGIWGLLGAAIPVTGMIILQFLKH